MTTTPNLPTDGHADVGTATDTDTDTVPAGRHAAEMAAQRHALHVDVPGLGTVTLPPAEQLVFIAGVSTLALLDVIAWPVAAVLAVGHLLAGSEHHRLLRDFGLALEEG